MSSKDDLESDQDLEDDQDAPRAAPQPYKYTRLPSNSIRLLELLPSPEDDIYSTLKTVSLDDAPRFDALSYSWANPITIREAPIPKGEAGLKEMQRLSYVSFPPTGHGSGTISIDPRNLAFVLKHNALPYMDREHGRGRSRTIYCDGMTMPVTNTLLEALIQLRRIIMSKKDAEKSGMVYLETLPVPRSKYIWIDAVCINQDDIDERNAQVPLMNQIYASAQYVFAWIGEYDTLAEAGFVAVQEMARKYRDEAKTFTITEIWKSLDAVLDRDEVYALVCLLSRLWFRRAWVVQEAVYARRLYIWAGFCFLDWWHLLPAIWLLETERTLDWAVNVTTSLIRREPFSSQGKKLRQITAKYSGEILEPAVEDGEIRDYVKGAVSFVEGVVDVKKRLGFQTFRPYWSDKDVVQTDLPEEQTAPRSASVSDSYLQALRSEITHLSEPFHDGPEPFLDRTEATGARINPAFINHDFIAEEPKPPVPVSLFSLITRFRGVGASDPRDKVFAFLHLATEEPDLKANYRATAQFVFMRTAQLILKSDDLSLLSHVQDPSETKVAGLPSWVPDFSVSLRRTPFVVNQKECPYNASGSTFQVIIYLTAEDPKSLVRTEILGLSGYKLDVVADVIEERGCYFSRVGQLASRTPKIYPKRMDGDYMLKAKLFYRVRSPETELSADDETIIQDPSQVPRVEALWRTLVADFSVFEFPARGEVGYAFADWVTAHIHHSLHLEEHYTIAAATNPSHTELRARIFNQRRKRVVWKVLAAGEQGEYQCSDCFTFYSSLARYAGPWQDYEKQGYTPRMHAWRYLPDEKRLAALQDCSYGKSHNDTKSAGMIGGKECPAFQPAERIRKELFEARMQEVKAGRRLFRTETGLLGMGPKSTAAGDEVWVIPGAKVPFVLRPFDGGRAPKRYSLVGEAYVHGYMNGEVLREGRERENFGLV
ncbi:heterokaryon incompatibility protein-domain-containing protein [Massariosphaeria phaeospora]|uniref:Heterokaryon incompatibility protein-domain-containing protein n=1 Tax=Massariosphaeria phaeospora TaxID=100035 RepID=A0A7C8MAF2_9PLEO|nr:heterokaryon incompatibility protein-domain-containing protein [Massariosphaeria phaeospora]